MSGNNVHVKLQFGSEYRRFFIQSDSKFSQLKEKIATILNLKDDFTIRYLDEEKEWITIGSDVELETGFVLVDKIFRLQVISNPSSTPKSEEPPKINPVPETQTDQDDDLVDEEDHCFKRGRGKGGKGRHGQRGEWKKWKKEKHWGHKGKFDDNNSDEDGDENLSLDEIKKVVSSLSEELKLLAEKKQKLREEMIAIKTKIGDSRRNTETPKETILAMRDEAVKKRQEMRVLFVQIKHSKSRIQKLRSIAVTKE